MVEIIIGQKQIKTGKPLGFDRPRRTLVETIEEKKKKKRKGKGKTY